MQLRVRLSEAQSHPSGFPVLDQEAPLLPGQVHLVDAQGNEFEEFACSYEHTINTGPLVLELPYTGDYYFLVVHLAPAVYHFGFNLDRPAPPVGLLD